ncbi:hypothetical protein [Mariniflexile sp.]|uniref:hypothetical protein n=1 Tax=Mariniflexile sp. TaxID=1979402 RepID=UPI0035627CFF
MNDRIIGKWQVIETYQSGELVETNNCFQYIQSEFKKDGIMVTGFINSNTAPENCTSSFVFRNLVWNNNGTEFYNLSDPLDGVVAIAYFESDKLVITLSEQPHKQVYIKID